MLTQKWETHNNNIGTVFILPIGFSDGDKLDSFLEQENTLSAPRALLTEKDNRKMLHVPRTNDTGYIQNYYHNPFPDVDKSINSNLYTNACKKEVYINEFGDIKSKDCYQKDFNTVIAILLILAGLFL